MHNSGNTVFTEAYTIIDKILVDLGSIIEYRGWQR
jgi:hypothetical protein